MFSVEAANRKTSGGSGASGSAAAKLARLGLVGAGQMGAGIAATAVTRGLGVVLRDVDAARLDEAKARAQGEVARVDVESVDVESAWQSTTGWGGFDAIDAVIEAVFELPELKQEILAAVSGVVPDSALIATNTSAIPISTLAPSVPSPQRFLGMHFFSPVERMPLVELVAHTGTSAETIARATGLARQLGKTPVGGGLPRGFFTSRVYARGGFWRRCGCSWTDRRRADRR